MTPDTRAWSGTTGTTLIPGQRGSQQDSGSSSSQPAPSVPPPHLLVALLHGAGAWLVHPGRDPHLPCKESRDHPGMGSAGEELPRSPIPTAGLERLGMWSEQGFNTQDRGIQVPPCWHGPGTWMTIPITGRFRVWPGTGGGHWSISLHTEGHRGGKSHLRENPAHPGVLTWNYSLFPAHTSPWLVANPELVKQEERPGQ